MSSKLLPLDMWALTIYLVRTALTKANTFQQLGLLQLWTSKCPFYFPVLNYQQPSTPFSVDRHTQLLVSCNASVSFKQCGSSASA